MNEGRTFIIPVSFEMGGYIAMKAGSAEEAFSKAKAGLKDLPIPGNASYVGDSYRIDVEDPEDIEFLTERFEAGKLGAEPTPADAAAKG